jgi:hypothetical protein
MIALIDTVKTRMGSDGISGIMTGMMPLIRSKVNEVDEKTLQQISNIMAQAFEKVSDPNVSEAEFTEWLKFDSDESK